MVEKSETPAPSAQRTHHRLGQFDVGVNTHYFRLNLGLAELNLERKIVAARPILAAHQKQSSFLVSNA